MFDKIVWEIPLQEATFLDEDDRKELEVVVLEHGRSKNGNYYSETVAESLASHLLAHPKVHKDHKDSPQIRKYGRSVEDWAATVREAKGEQGKTIARIDMTSNPLSVWLYDEAKKNPSDVQLSIDASAKISKGKGSDGKEGNNVEEFLRAQVDFVAYGAAGGRVERILASEEWKEEIEEAKILTKYLDQRINSDKENKDYWAVFDALRDFLRGVTLDEGAEEKEKAGMVNSALEEFKNKVTKLDLRTIFGKKGTELYMSYVEDMLKLGELNVSEEVLEAFQMALGLEDVDWDSVEIVKESEIKEASFSDTSWASVNKSDLPASAFLIVGDKNLKKTWHLPYKDLSGKINKGALRALSVIVKSGQFRGKKLAFSIPAAVRATIERLLKLAKIGQYKTKTVKQSESEGGDIMEKSEVMEALKGNPEWIKEVPGIVPAADFKEIKEAFEANKKVLEEVQKNLDNETIRREASEKAQQVDNLLKESALTEKQVKETFRNRLLKMDKEEEIKEAITELETVIKEASGKVTDNPPSSGKKKSISESKAWTDEDAAARLK